MSGSAGSTEASPLTLSRVPLSKSMNNIPTWWFS